MINYKLKEVKDFDFEQLPIDEVVILGKYSKEFQSKWTTKLWNYNKKQDNKIHIATFRDFDKKTLKAVRLK